MTATDLLHSLVKDAIASGPTFAKKNPQFAFYFGLRPIPHDDHSWGFERQVSLQTEGGLPWTLATNVSEERHAALTDALRTDDELGINVPSFTEEWEPALWAANQIVTPAVRAVLLQRQDFWLDKPTWMLVLDQLRQYLNAEKLPVVVCCGLANLEGSATRIRFDRDVEALRLSPEDRARLWVRLGNRLRRSESTSWQGPMRWRYVLRHQLAWPKGEYPPKGVEDAALRHALRVLRLHCGGQIVTGLGWTEAAEPFAALDDKIYLPSGALDPPQFDAVVVREEDEERLQALYRGAERCQDKARVEFAFRRLDFASERSRAEDRLVDLWIGLEALFGPAKERGDLANRLATRIAWSLEQDGKRRKRRRSKVLGYYDIRSKVVHGNPTVTPATVTKVASRSHQLLREALCRWLLP